MPPTTAIDRFKRIAKDNGLPPSPRAAGAVVSLAQRAQFDSRQLAVQIGTDAALTAAIIALANRDTARLERARSLDAALAQIGPQMSAGLLHHALTNGAFPYSDDPRLQHAWTRIEEDAKFASALAMTLGSVPADLVRTYCALRDCGTLALMPCFPGTKSSDAFENADAQAASIEIDHARAGALLASSWGLEPGLVDAIRNHHAPDAIAPHGQGGDVSQQLIAIGLLADWVRAPDFCPDWERTRPFIERALGCSADQIQGLLGHTRRSAPRTSREPVCEI